MLLSCLAPAAGAATVEVLVRAERASMEGLVVVLEAGDETTSAYYRESRTGAGGLARFNNVSPGTYTVGVRKVPEGYLPPADNPLRPPPVFTVVEEGEPIEVTVDLIRGVPVTVTVDAENPAGFRAIFRQPETEKELTSSFNAVEAGRTRLLAPLTWHVSVRPQPGALLVDVRHDGQPVAGNEVVLDLAAHPAPTTVSWTYAAPARLTGRVRSDEEIAGRIYVEFELLRPGAWIEDAERRGGSSYERLGARIRDGRFEASVPDGRWRVRPVGQALLESRPPEVEVEVGPGQEGFAEFDVTLVDPDAQSVVFVDVVDPEGARVAGAAIEIYGADAADGGQAPALVKEVSSLAGTPVEGLPAGADVLFVAGHADFLEGRLLRRDFRPEPQERIRLELRAGGVVRLRTEDAAGAPIAGARLRLERLRDDLRLQLRDETVAAARLAREAVTDDSGRTILRGLYPGRYRASVGSPGVAGAGAQVMLVGPAGGDLQRQAEVDVQLKEPLDLLARRQPAVSGVLELACGDGWTLPGQASFYVYDARAVGGEAILAHDGARLGGPLSNRLEIGPLASGLYLVAIRPAGFTRWTWAPGTTDENAAAALRVDTEGAVDQRLELGGVTLECAPAVDVVPEAADGGALPPFTEVAVAASVHQDGGALKLNAAARQDRFALRGLPRGETRVDVILEHPAFLPEPALRWYLPVALERGEYLEIAPQIENVGGAVEVICRTCIPGDGATDGSVAYARLEQNASGGKKVLAERPLTSGRALFPSLLPGTYDVALCEDASCAKVLRRWPGLQVRRAQVVRVRADDQEAE